MQGINKGKSELSDFISILKPINLLRIMFNKSVKKAISLLSLRNNFHGREKYVTLHNSNISHFSVIKLNFPWNQNQT